MLPDFVLLILLAAFLAAGFYIGARALLEPQQPEFTSFTLPPEADEQGKERLRAVFFSDYHHPLNHLAPEVLFRFIRESKPDVVIFGGDMASGTSHMEEGRFISRRLEAYCHDLGIPYLAVRGNHDEGLREEQHFPLLINQYFLVRTKDGSLWQLLGLEDLRLGKIDLERALLTPHPLSEKLPPGSEVPPSRRIILAHNPDSVLFLPKGEAAFCLSGHFHGGQIRLPFKMEYMLLRKECLCRCGMTEGLHAVKGMWHFISRGWGEVLFPFRLFVRPEVSLLEFYAASKEADSAANDETLKKYLDENPPAYKQKIIR